MAVVKVPLKKEENKGHVWAKLRFVLLQYLGLPGRFIVRVITMVWLRYLYILGPKLKTTLLISEFHSVLSLEPEIDAFVFSQLSGTERLFGHKTSYEILLVKLRLYTNDQDLKSIKNIKLRANFLIRMIALIIALYPFKVR